MSDEIPPSPSPDIACADLGVHHFYKWEAPTLEAMQAMLPEYQFISLIGCGGMAAVYKAVQVSLHRLVAIKVLPRELFSDKSSNYVERFKHEARIMARLSHPGIVSVYDFGETPGGLLYIVMEFVDGTDVAHMVKSQGKLTPEHALAITAHICDALQYAHSLGVIHRDIKPSNVLMNQHGHIKIADFGLALATLTNGCISDCINSTNGYVGGLTKVNMAMGTPDYVAPETLVAGARADQRSDLYAVGVMLYNMLTGEIPRGIFKMPSLKNGSDPRFDAIIAKAMEPQPEERYQKAFDIRRDLDEIQTTPIDIAEEPQKKSGRGMVIGTVTVLVMSVFFTLKKPAPPGIPLPLPMNVDQQTIDLLELVDVGRDAIMGKWTMTADGWELTDGDLGLLEFPYGVPEEYDFEIEFTLKTQGNNVNQYISAQGHGFVWKLNAHTHDSLTHNFKLLDENLARDATEVREELQLDIRHRSTIEVRKGSLRELLDGKEIVKWTGDFSRFSMESSTKLHDPYHIGMGSYKGGVVFHRAVLRSVGIPLPKNGIRFSTATMTAPFINSLGMKFIPVPIIGGPTDGHRELFSIWETRVQDYKVFSMETRREWQTPRFSQEATHPAVNVSWDDAQAFCTWLTKRDQKAGILSANKHYRLPSDHEWSCLVGLGEQEDAAQMPADKDQKTANVFPWGDGWPPPAGAGNYAGEEMSAEVVEARDKEFKDYLVGYKDDFVRTSPVGSFAANRYGLYDIGGNVSEWCEDWFDGQQKQKVCRDAAFNHCASGSLLSSKRRNNTPVTIGGSNGFRCIIEMFDPLEAPSTVTNSPVPKASISANPNPDLPPSPLAPK